MTLCELLLRFYFQLLLSNLTGYRTKSTNTNIYSSTIVCNLYVAKFSWYICLLTKRPLHYLLSFPQTKPYFYFNQLFFQISNFQFFSKAPKSPVSISFLQVIQNASVFTLDQMRRNITVLQRSVVCKRAWSLSGQSDRGMTAKILSQ